MNQQQKERITEDGEVVTTTGLPIGYDEHNQSLAVSLLKGELDTQIATAKHYPRDISRTINNILSLATIDEETAEECIYALPRAGKPIKGPSIRLAEIIQSQFGNNRVGTRVVHVDRIEKYVEAEGIFHDLETNTATTARVRRRISDKRGRLLTDDMIIVTGNAAASIAKRNAILAGVPKAIWRRAYHAVESVLAGDVKTLVERRSAALKAFAAFGVTPEQVCTALEIQGVDNITLEHLPTLIGMHSALKNSEASVEEMFGEGAGKAAQPRPAPPPEDETIEPQVPIEDEKESKESLARNGNSAGDSEAALPHNAQASPDATDAETPPATASVDDFRAKRKEAVDKLLVLASDPDVTPQQRLENLEGLQPAYEDQFEGDDSGFQQALFSTIGKVARGELKPAAARKYLEALK